MKTVTRRLSQASSEKAGTGTQAEITATPAAGSSDRRQRSRGWRSLRAGQLRSGLEVILKNFCGQRGRHLVSVALHGSNDFAATNYFCSRESCDLRRQHKIDFKDNVRLQRILRLKQQAGAADVSGFPIVPFLFVEAAVLQRQVKLKTLRARER